MAIPANLFNGITEILKNYSSVMKKLLSIPLLIFVLTGCASSGANLEPSEYAQGTDDDDDIVTRSFDNVKMTIDADAWTGDEAVLQEVTPVQVTITNNSDSPLAVRYQNFALVSSEGEQFAALPPFQVEGSVNEAEMISPYGPIDPAFSYDGFALSPYYGGLYDGIGVYDTYGFGPYDMYYYDEYGTYWQDIQLPTEPMLERALPEGVVKPGGQVKGFIYFENVDAEDVNRVWFQADLQAPKDEGAAKFGQISIPFNVKEDS